MKLRYHMPTIRRLQSSWYTLMYRSSMLVLLCVVSIFVAQDLPDRPRGTVSVVVTVDPARPLPVVARAIQALGYTVHRRLDDLHALEATGPALDTAAGRRLEAVSGVRYAEPIAPVAATDLPSDPLFGDQYAYLQVVGAPAAWDITTGSPSVIVAVVDTGVDVQHANLKANIWVNPGEISNNGVDDDGNGCVDDVNGCSFVSDSSPGCENAANGYVNDDIGHGTFVAGVIGAAANHTGIVGVARNVRIMAVKVLDCHGEGDSIATARGILYAAHNGARIINLSLGGLQDAQIITDAINQAVSEGVLVVAAAGNEGTATLSFPARLPNVLAVGAASLSDPSRRAPFSNWGQGIGVVAIGEHIIGPVPASRCNIFLRCLSAGPWASGDGTSFSAPQVSGLAALMLSLDPTLSPARLTDIIKSSATPLPPADTPGWAGFGRINMAEALRSVKLNRPPGDPCVVASVIDGQTFKCQDGRTIRMLQIAAPTAGQCGGDWAKAALQNIFLTPGRTVYLRYDVTRTDPQGATIAAPVWRGDDGADYNLSIVMVYVGLARSADVGSQNTLFHDWAQAAQAWAHSAAWNMWAPGKPFAAPC
jgi:subtilisin family serine protease